MIPPASYGVDFKLRRDGGWGNWSRSGCYSGNQYSPEVLGLRLRGRTVFDKKLTAEYLNPLLALDWGWDKYDPKSFEFEWDFTKANTRPKMFAFACLIRYLHAFPAAVIEWKRLCEFMSPDEAYLVCIHSRDGGNGAWGSPYFCPTLSHLKCLKGFKLQQIIDIADTGKYHKTAFMMFSLIDQLPQFYSFGFVDKVIDVDFRWPPISASKRMGWQFTPEIYNWIEKNKPLTKANWPELIRIIDQKEEKPKHEVIDFGNI